MSESLGDAILHLRTDDSKLDAGLNQARSKAQSAAADFDKIGSRMQAVGGRLSLAVTTPIVGMGAAAIKMAGDFEASMGRLGISSQAGSAEMAKMRDLARDIGKDTVFSATEAADAMDMLAKNGVATADILNGAARASVNLAAATGSELGPATSAVTDVMSQFNIKTAELPRTVDLITGAVNESKMDFADFSTAISQGGAAAASAGVSFADFNASIAGISPNFSSGSDAGTSFKAFLAGMTPNSDQAAAAIKQLGLNFYDAQGNMLPMSNIAGQLKEKLGGLSEEARAAALEKIFGADGMRTAIGLMNLGADGLDKIKAKIGETDAAAQSAERMKGFNAQMEQLGGAVEDLSIAIGDAGLLSGLTSVVKGITGFVEGLSRSNPVILQIIMALAGLLAAAGPVAMIGGTMLRAWSVIGPVFSLLSSGILKVIPIIANLGRALMVLGANPIFLVIAALVAGVYLAWQNWDKIKAIISGVGQSISSWYSTSVKPVFDQVKAIIDQAVGWFRDTFGGQIKALVAMVSALLRGDFKGAWEAAKNFVKASIDGALKILETLAPGATAAIRSLASSFAKGLGDLVTRMIGYGKDIVTGLVNGIRAAPEAVWNALKWVVMRGVDGIRNFLGIASPSRLFMEMGGFVTEGFAKGILDGLPEVEAAMAEFAKTVENGAPQYSSQGAEDVDWRNVQTPEGGWKPDVSMPPEAEASWREGFARTFADGLKAALDGDFGSWFDQFLDGLVNTGLQALGNLIGGGIESLLGGGGGGGIGQLLSSIFGGGFATGGLLPLGQWGIAGEKGPEPFVSTPKGTLVRPSTALSSMQTTPAAPSVSITTHIDATGADAAAISRIVSRMDQFEADLPAKIVETTQDAADRRIINLGGPR